MPPRADLLTLSSPVMSPGGALLGVTGADVRVIDLTHIITAIRMRNGGEVHLFHATTGAYVAGPQARPHTARAASRQPAGGYAPGGLLPRPLTAVSRTAAD